MLALHLCVKFCQNWISSLYKHSGASLFKLGRFLAKTKAKIQIRSSYQQKEAHAFYGVT